ncbi:MAG TPA: hypothetical protein VFO28_00585 [Burkholderiaceae bacterium]|nr:hypothetical protein [Burkholderiaceae bacterium]
MPLLGSAAMLLSFDVVPEAVAEHDHWHTFEHLPERLSIPGFLRGTRWIALEGQPRYMVLYEVESLATLTSAAYLERLNHPSSWTAKIMPSYRGMRRGFCAVAGSFGHGLGHLCALLRFKPPSDAAALRHWLLHDALPELPSRPGLGSVHWLEGALTPAMTQEQRIRGADAGVDSALLLTGYDPKAIAELLQGQLGAAALARHGALDVTQALYRMDYSLTGQ